MCIMFARNNFLKHSEGLLSVSYYSIKKDKYVAEFHRHTELFPVSL